MFINKIDITINLFDSFLNQNSYGIFYSLLSFLRKITSNVLHICVVNNINISFEHKCINIPLKYECTIQIRIWK